MKKIFLLFLALILIACSPQVTATSTVTSPPPTETPIPTPTLHPDFVAVQNQLAELSEHLTLLPDGTIEELTTDGGRQTIPNLYVDEKGLITILVKGEKIKLTIADLSFDDQEGLVIDGYELDDNGEWAIAVSPAMQKAEGYMTQYHVDPESVTINTGEDGAVEVVDNETGKVLIRTTEYTSKFDLGFAVDTIASASCDPTDFVPRDDGRMDIKYDDQKTSYVSKILKELGIDENIFAIRSSILLNREKQCWGFVVEDNFFYRDTEHVAHKIPLLHMSKEELIEFLHSRYTE